MSVPVSGTFYVTAVVDGENAIEYRIKPNIAAIKMDPNNIQSIAASFNFVKAEGSVETPLSVYPRLRIYDKAGSVLLDNKIASASTGYSYLIPQGSYGTASSLNITIYSDNAHTNQLATVTLNIVRETPRYAGIMGEWSDELEFNNGNYILIDGIVYVWSNPIPGNSSIPPLNDIQNNPNTTSWVAYDYWPLIGTDFLLARRIKSEEIEVDNVIADGIFGKDLDVENAILRNLTVNRLGTTANPYAGRFANVGYGIGVFRNLDDESSIDNAIIGMGKDISIMQQAGERKPAFVVRDKQWRGTYSSSTIYYKDDRAYYSSHLGAATWSSSASYNIGTYVTYNSTVWVCTTTNSGYKPYVGSPYWNADGGTYIFTKDWLGTETPSAGYLPTNVSYWQYLGSGNLGGGSYSELGSEGMFSNGSNIMGFAASVGLTANVSAAYLLQKRNSQANGISAAVLGIDQTDETYGPSKSYGGYFNSAYIGRVVHNIRNVSHSGDILKSDYKIHSYASSAITLTLPIADNSMIGQDIFVRKLGAGNVTVIRGGSQSIWLSSAITSTVVDYNALTLFTWDGNYWVVNEMNN